MIYQYKASNGVFVLFIDGKDVEFSNDEATVCIPWEDLTRILAEYNHLYRPSPVKCQTNSSQPMDQKTAQS